MVLNQKATGVGLPVALVVKVGFTRSTGAPREGKRSDFEVTHFDDVNVIGVCHFEMLLS